MRRGLPQGRTMAEIWIYITIYLKDGTEENTKYYLKLGKSWPEDD